MAFFGAFFAVVATVFFFAWWKKYPLARMLDVTALVGLIAQTIGRFGNVVNGDVIGPQTDRPWGFIYTHPDSFAPDTFNAYHPASVYAIIGNLVLIGILFPLRHRFAPGWFAISYVAGYCIAAMVVFYWRSEPVIALGLRQAQWTALVILAATAVVAFWYWRRGNPVFVPGGDLSEARLEGDRARRRRQRRKQ
jgi:phosphatidylglycerol---prolipoprotein diacylglyceryl transferase